MRGRDDAIVVGAGPNGLAAAIVLALAGRRVTVFEADATIGGGCRSAELTLPGFVHDICSAVHPLAVGSPFFRRLPLADFGLDWVEPPLMVAHPLDDGRAAIVERDVRSTAEDLGVDGPAYRRLFGSLVRAWPDLESTILGPPGLPAHPLSAARFAWAGRGSAEGLARRHFSTPRARALVAGMAAHAMIPLHRIPTGAVALVLGATAHTAGWSFPRGGAQRLSDALAGYLRSLGGEIVVNSRIRSVDDLPPAAAVLCDLSPRPLLAIAGHRFPAWYRRKLESYRYGPGAFKVDWALGAPVPWRDPHCARAGTVHIGGTLEEISAAERAPWAGVAAERPYVLFSQPTLFDESRAPGGRHVAWAYCHVPSGCTVDMLPRIEAQIERFAPGFRERVLARHVMTPADIERHNPNMVGGDIGAGVVDLRQLFTRPTCHTYSTPVRGLYICSASTPPGVGVHGMCGYHAAQRVLGK